GHEDEQQERGGQREVDHRGPAVLRQPGAAPHSCTASGPVTPLMALSKRPLSCSPAMAQIPVTSAAVIRVISTQPGTSPVSSPRRDAAARIFSEHRRCALMSGSVMVCLLLRGVAGSGGHIWNWKKPRPGQSAKAT